MKATARPYSFVGRLRLTLWAMLLLPVLSGVGFFLLHSNRALQDDAARDLNAVLSLQRQFIEQWVAERSADIGYLAADPRVLTLPPAALRDMLQSLLHETASFKDIVYVDRQGVTRADPRYPSGVDVSDREYFRAARRGQGFISDVLESRATGDRIFIVSNPVRDAQGRFQGLVFGSVSLDTLATLLRTMRAQSASNTFLVQAGGALIAPQGVGRDLRPGDPLFERARARENARGVYKSAAGERVVGTYQWIQGGKWLLAAERPEKDIVLKHAWILGAPLAGAAAVFLLLGPALLRLARSLRAPIERLEEHARQIEAGNFDVDCQPLPDEQAPEELRRLDQAYCLMVQRVRGAMEELRQSSFTDHLTSAANRKLLFHEGPRLVEAARRAGQSVSLLMLDLDNFKNVNDTHGHAAGDVVLSAFAELLRGSLRKSDLLVRFGGEEFLVLAPNSGSTAASELGERIRRAVEHLCVDVGGVTLCLTVSIGITVLASRAELPADSALDALLARADEALYRAKAAGRNRVETLPLSPDRPACAEGCCSSS